MILNLPWWIYLVIIFIVWSGYMSYRAMRAERLIEQQYIEREGQVYMDRIRKERRRKHRTSSE